MVLKQPDSRMGKTFNAIHFNIDNDNELKENCDQIAFRLRWNHWNRKRTAQIVIEDVK